MLTNFRFFSLAKLCRELSLGFIRRLSLKIGEKVIRLSSLISLNMRIFMLQRIKKSPGPEFESYDVAKVVTDERCDYCLQTAAHNRRGKHEDLLICKDCNAKGTIGIKAMKTASCTVQT